MIADWLSMFMFSMKIPSFNWISEEDEIKLRQKEETYFTIFVTLRFNDSVVYMLILTVSKQPTLFFHPRQADQTLLAVILQQGVWEGQIS